MVDYTDEEWEHIGRAWRKAAGMADAIRIDAPAFVRWLKHAGCIKDYVCVPDEDLPNAEGKYEPDEDRIYYRNSTWRGALEGYPHDVWTLVHEGCHPILKHKATRLRSSVQHADRFSSRDADRDEVDANRLAASILAPFDKVDFKPGMTGDYLREQFGLSRPASERRLREFDRMYRQKHGIKRELPAGIVDFLSAQKRKGYPVTSLAAFDFVGQLMAARTFQEFVEISMAHTRAQLESLRDDAKELAELTRRIAETNQTKASGDANEKDSSKPSVA